MRRLRSLVAACSLILCSLAPAGSAGAHDEGVESSEDPGGYGGGPCTLVGPFGVPGVPPAPSLVGEWGGVETWPDQGTHAAVLHTGKVLWWRNALTVPAHVYDPATGTNTPVPVPPGSGDWMCPGLATLADGRVIAVGGGGGSSIGQKSVIRFDPVSQTWTRLADMHVARWYPTVRVLHDGRVLAATGFIAGNIAPIPEIYDPDTGAWTLLPAAELLLPIYGFLFPVPGGGIVYAGNATVSSTYEEPTWTLDLATQQWSFIGSQNHLSLQSSPAMIRPGKILKVGGQDPAVNTAEILDMTAATPAWTPVAPMAFPRRRTDLVLLPDGTALALGGGIATQGDPKCAVHAPEVYDPDTDTWTQWRSAARPRLYHSVSLLLPDGRVLVAGGENLANGGEKNAEIFSPPYLFRGPRPSVTAGPGAGVYGEEISLSTPDAASIESVALMRPSAVTHNYDQDQLYVPLEHETQPGGLAVTLPDDPNVAPPGYYMIFLVGAQGVPSVAHWLRLAPAPCPGQDMDFDLVLDCDDNCPLLPNGSAQAGTPGVGNQTDTDADASGDACDADDENDSLPDSAETDTGVFVSLSDTGSDPRLWDTDGDGIYDRDEVLEIGSDPNDVDSDGDTLDDGDEVEQHGTDPLDTDSDADGLDDHAEIFVYGTDPLDPDTDGDGWKDGYEVSHGAFPLVPESVPVPAAPVWGVLALAGLLLVAAARARRR
jgi:hypothetical protein